MSKTIFITGASSGIGLASANLFYENGWNVIATMRTPDKSELSQLDASRMLVARLDVSDSSTIPSAIQAGIAKFGKIDVLVNNAGYAQNGIFETVSQEKVQEQFDVNVFGVMEVTRAILPHFRANKSGGVINVSSGAGLIAFPLMSIYVASKFALEGFTEALSFELGSQNIFVKSIIPHGGVTATNFIQKAVGVMPTDLGPSVAKDYEEYGAKIGEYFGKMIPNLRTSSSDVAQAIYAAATDGTDKLRYLIGDDARGLIKARYGSKSDEAYMSVIRSQFE